MGIRTERLIFAIDMNHRMLRTCLSLVMIAASLEGAAQRQITILDMDTHLPVANVSVRAGGRVVSSDAIGRVRVDSLADSISFRHVHYLPERMRSYEVGDTMYLLPQDHVLDEVVVMELNPKLKGMVSGWALQGAMAGAAEAPAGVAQFDFGMMLDRRRRRDKKHKEQAKEILEKWEEAEIYKR